MNVDRTNIFYCRNDTASRLFFEILDTSEFELTAKMPKASTFRIKLDKCRLGHAGQAAFFAVNFEFWLIGIACGNFYSI